jgi:hypothetical protein
MTPDRSSSVLAAQTVWPIDRIKDQVSKIGSGITPTGGAAAYLDSGIPLLRSQNVHFEGLQLDDVAYIGQQTHGTGYSLVLRWAPKLLVADRVTIIARYFGVGGEPIVSEPSSITAAAY